MSAFNFTFQCVWSSSCERWYSWSRNSRYVLTASKDWNVVIWDLASETDPPKRKTIVRFDAPVASAAFHPRNRHVPFMCL